MDIILPETTAVHERIVADNSQGYGPQTRQQINMGFDISALAYIKAGRFGNDLRRKVDELFEDVDILISPTTPWVAPCADLPAIVDEGTIEMRFMVPWNLTGHPALSVPSGLAEDDLPAGLQLVGPRDGDVRLLRIAEAWTRLMPLPAPPSFGNASS